MAVDKQVEGKAWRPSETLGHRPGEGQGKPAPHLGMGGGRWPGQKFVWESGMHWIFLKQK